MAIESSSFFVFIANPLLQLLWYCVFPCLKPQNLASQENKDSPFWSRRLSRAFIFSRTWQRQHVMAIFAMRFITWPARSILRRSAAADRFHRLGWSSHFWSFAPCPAPVACLGRRSAYRFDSGLCARTGGE